MTLVRLPTTPTPPPVGRPQELGGTVPELLGVLVARNAEARVAEQCRGLLRRCDSVLLVDRSSSDGTVQAAREAGARVLELASPAGEGDALRAGLQLARELGYIAAVWPGPHALSDEDLDRLVLAQQCAPEAFILGVGPGQAIAGTEWDEARALAEGRDAQPAPDYRPPRSTGLTGKAELWFERVVQTRYAYPWGGPRVLPLQSILRRDLREPGAAIHMEMLALAAHSGVPTIEVELAAEPAREVPTCRKAAARLLGRFVPLVLRSSAAERLGLGGGYAPPTTSPLQLLLAASLALGIALLTSGCPKAVPPVLAEGPCEDPAPVASWPGEGDPDAALEELLAERAGFVSVWVEQGVEVFDPELEGPRALRGVLARDEEDRLRIRLLAPMGMTVLDYVQADGLWQLTVPPARLLERGTVGEASELLASRGGILSVPPDRVAQLFLSVDAGTSVQWKTGSCAVLEVLDPGGAVTRRLVYRSAAQDWEVAREELLFEGDVELVARFSDYRAVGESGLWPYRQEVEEPVRGARLTFNTLSLKTDGVDAAFFALPGKSD